LLPHPEEPRILRGVSKDGRAAHGSRRTLRVLLTMRGLGVAAECCLIPEEPRILRGVSKWKRAADGSRRTLRVLLTMRGLGAPARRR
jgi:hypothetical protein